jgi:uncharacterized membrane protein
MSILVLAVIGGFLGAGVLGAGSPAGFWMGASLGALVGWINKLAKRVDALEQQTHTLRTVQPQTPAAERVWPAESTREAAAARRPEPDFVPPRPGAEPPPQSSASAGSGAEPPPRPGLADGQPSAGALEPSLLAVGLRHAKRWLTTGNVPVKVGIVLSVFGVGFLVKEGIDRNWLIVPLEIRLLLVALFGIALLAIGWRLRKSHPSYALSVQGGGIAVLYLTTYASFALYALLPAVLAFGLLIGITAAAGALAVLQDTRSLAVLGIIGGFMAPVLTSDGSGNHVALFSYYAILNLAIVGIAWFKSWRELNVLGFAFTFGIGSLWGYQAYRPEHFASTEPFLVLFVLMYTLIPVLFATRQSPQLRGFVDGTLVFGTPVVGFALQSQLVGDSEYGLAISALALAGLYIGVATYLFRRRADDLRMLVESLLALSIVFLTIAVPLALDARWTSAAWALQGAAMIWLGVRQRRRLALAAGCALQLLAGVAYTLQSSIIDDGWPVLNGYCIGAVLIAAAGFISSRLFDRHRDPQRKDGMFVAMAALFVWASAWWLMAGFAEIDRYVAARFEGSAQLVFAAATTVLAMLAAAAADWRRLNALGLVLWPIALFGVVLGLSPQWHPSASYGWLAWPAAAAAMFAFLRLREQQFALLQSALHATGFWLIAALIGSEARWQVDRVADGIWPFSAALTAVAVLVLATLHWRERLSWPLAAHARTYVQVCCAGVLAVLTLFTLWANLISPGVAEPLPYVPILNPLELSSAFGLLVLVQWWRASSGYRKLAIEPERRAAAGALLGLFLLTMAVARAVHHWTGVPFDVDALADSTVLQAALSIVWGLTGLVAMVLGARGRQRAVWIGGAALMGVVVVKLFLVELDNTGTLGRVVSFLGVGLLLLVVGYFAPVPPRTELDKSAA